MLLQKRKIVLVSLFIVFILLILLPRFISSNDNKSTRDGVIVEVPISAFDDKGRLIDPGWRNYLKHNKPIGIIFFADHFIDKNKSKQIIKDIKDTVNDKVILSADEEGGRINRIKWLNVKSAEEIAFLYNKLKIEKSEKEAREFVKQQYKEMFNEMRELGLNMTFAPNLDLNKYGNLDKNSEEYKNYKQCVKYVELFRLKMYDKVNGLSPRDIEIAEMFFVFLEEQGIRKLDTMRADKNYNNNIRLKWRTLDNKYRNKLKKHFQKLAQYANYASVVGDRSFGYNPEFVSKIAEIFVETAKEYGITCVMKHALGHGRVDGDTHLEKQHISVSVEEILNDIKPYQKLSKKVHYVMLSHIIYDVIDKNNSAVNSRKVLDFIHKHINNEVISITDDISMGGAENQIKNPCDLWIISDKPLDEVMKISVLNRIDKNKAEYILSKMV